MELHKMQEILHINDNIRSEMRRFSDEAFSIGIDRQGVMELFRVTFIDKYYRDFYSFKSFVQVMVADTYMMLLQDIKQNCLDSDDLFIYLLISNLMDNPSNFYEEIFKYIENKSAFFEVMVDYTICFEKLSILGKKNIVQSSRIREERITKLCPIYQIDVMNYGLATTVEDFIHYYNDTTENVVLTPDVIVKDIEYHMRHLYSFNRENYIDNLNQMAEGFYKWIKIQVDMNDYVDENLMNYIELLQNKTNEEICELSITDKKFLFHVIDCYCEYMVSDEIIVRGTYISKESLDEYMEDKIPISIRRKRQQKAKK